MTLEEFYCQFQRSKHSYYYPLLVSCWSKLLNQWQDYFFSVSGNKYTLHSGGILNSYRKHLLKSSVITIRHLESHLKVHRDAKAALWKPTSTSLRHTLQLFTGEAGVPSHLTADNGCNNRLRLSSNMSLSVVFSDQRQRQLQVQRILRRGFQSRLSVNQCLRHHGNKSNMAGWNQWRTNDETIKEWLREWQQATWHLLQATENQFFIKCNKRLAE